MLSLKKFWKTIYWNHKSQHSAKNKINADIKVTKSIRLIKIKLQNLSSRKTREKVVNRHTPTLYQKTQFQKERNKSKSTVPSPITLINLQTNFKKIIKRNQIIQFRRRELFPQTKTINIVCVGGNSGDTAAVTTTTASSELTIRPPRRFLHLCAIAINKNPFLFILSTRLNSLQRHLLIFEKNQQNSKCLSNRVILSVTTAIAFWSWLLCRVVVFILFSKRCFQPVVFVL